MKRVLAFDFGASSGRAIVAELDKGKIKLNEVHRFANEPVSVNGTVYWDVLRLFHDIKQGIIKAKPYGFDSIGIDTWGVDFGLIDEFGCLLENPIHYRDARNKGMIERSEKYISNEEMYEITGIQFMEFNTVFQLLSLAENRPHMLERTQKAVLMPDLFNYMLTGRKAAEYSMASTAQLLDVHTHDWSDRLIDKLPYDKNKLCEVIKPGTVVGMLTEELCEELGIESVPVVAVCSHDTQSAMVAVPSQEEDFAFLSCGTWSLFGTELPSPIVNETSQALNFTNEGGYDYCISFLKNIIGLWLIQESRRQWIREGTEYSYAELERLALAEEAFTCFIDPDAPEFTPMGNIPERVREFCRKTGQRVPESVGAVMRCIYESLAMKYKFTLDNLSKCTGKSYSRLHVVGGGVKDRLLLQMTADSCGIEVVAGPIEATVLGNIAVQLIASGDIRDIAEARKIIADSEELKLYSVKDNSAWSEAYERFCKIVK